MTTKNYQERLTSFADGKYLGQLTGVVRDPGDAVCDACGSNMARTLFGLKDTMADRCYFVGQSCLGSLTASGLIARRRYRQTARVAYRQEMDRRKDGTSGAGEESLAGAANGGAPRRTADLAGFRRERTERSAEGAGQGRVNDAAAPHGPSREGSLSRASTAHRTVGAGSMAGRLGGRSAVLHGS